MQLLLHYDSLIEVRDGTAGLREMLDRHYSAIRYRDGRKPAKILGPGEYLILICPDWSALLAFRVSNRPIAGQSGVYMSVFRRESHCPLRASELLRLAEPRVRQRWPNADRMFTFVDPRKVASGLPGYCYRRAGWRRCGTTQGGLLIFERYLAHDPCQR